MRPYVLLKSLVMRLLHTVYTSTHTHTELHITPKSDYICSCKPDQGCYTHTDQWWNLHRVCAWGKKKSGGFLIIVIQFRHEEWEIDQQWTQQLIKARPEAMALKRSVNCIDLLSDHIYFHSKKQSWDQLRAKHLTATSRCHSCSLEQFWKPQCPEESI